MYNCCCGNYQHKASNDDDNDELEQPDDSYSTNRIKLVITKDDKNAQNDTIEDLVHQKRSSPVSNRHYLTRCFYHKRKKKSKHNSNTKPHQDDANRPDNSNDDDDDEGSRLVDGPSITESENLDSLGNLPFTMSKSSKYPSLISPSTTPTIKEGGSNNCSNFLPYNPSNNHHHHHHHHHQNTLSTPSPTPNSNTPIIPPNTTSVTPNTPSGNTTVATSRRGSLYIFRHTEDLIVTPFAQILASLRNVRANFIFITNVHSSKEARFGSIGTVSHNLKVDENKVELDDNQKTLTVETLDELEWCLEQLESIQTHRSVSDMASSKFKKILNKELSQYADQTKSGNQISDYICNTFLDSDMNNQGGGGGGSNNASPLLTTNTGHGAETETFTPISINSRFKKSSGASSTASNSSLAGVNAGTVKSSGTVTTGNSLASPDNSNIVTTTSDYTLNSTNLDKLSAVNPASRTDQHQQQPLSSSPSIDTTQIPRKQQPDSSPPSTPDPRKVSVSFKDPSEEDNPTNTATAAALVTMDSDPITHDYDLDGIGYYGIQSGDQHNLTQLLDKSLDTWGLDIFQVAAYSDNKPLTATSFALFRKYDLFSKFSIEPRVFLNFITKIESQYLSNVPYHNSTHAADVTQSTNVLLGAAPLESVFSDLELMSVIFACIIHDVDHPGVTNQYLINTNDPLALLYNDSSVLENHHLSVAFTTLCLPDHDISANLTKKQRQSFRKMVIDMVLATDMSKHMSLLADLKTMVETKKVAGSGILNLDNYNDRIQILQNMVHCADLSNPTKPLQLYRNWTGRIMEEFFCQGDRERARNLDISPMCDRQTATVEKSQVSFIDFIVHPLWETWSDLVYPEAQDILDTLEDNRDWYFNQISAHTTDHADK